MSENVTLSFEWTPQRERAAFAVATSKTIREAAAAAAVSEKTLYRWLDDPAFKNRVEQHSELILWRARTKMQAKAEDAADMIIDIMQFGTQRHNTRLAAAKDILDRVGVKGVNKHQHTIITLDQVKNMTPEQIDALIDEGNG